MVCDLVLCWLSLLYEILYVMYIIIYVHLYVVTLLFRGFSNDVVVV